jgi:alginate O-acetyltransferase complex protein AlgI
MSRYFSKGCEIPPELRIRRVMMLFNSIHFAAFFPIVTLLYFLIPHRGRWLLLLSASCVFYMAFIPAYIGILFFTIIIDYFAALYIERSSGILRKRLLVMSITSTCLILFVFKYFGFFNDNLEALAKLIGWNYPVNALNIILPIGLSFHTFQSLSYVIEVYRGHQKPERHFGIYSLYVMFYPQLVAGPIERPQNLLHQFHEEKHFDLTEVTDGLKLMAWGLFKKVVIADRLAIYVNAVYDDPTQFGGPVLLLATIAFAYQIYCDFSGYSDIAIGAARVMGFKLMKNFDAPYFSQSIAEFWKRWHISLSTWFRDYVYIPLGGNRVPRWKFYRNLLITFGISGLWHGANWTYIVWGGLNGLYLIAGHVAAGWKSRFRELMHPPSNGPVLAGIRVASTFALICMAWIFFRSNSLSDAWYIVNHLTSGWTGAPRSVQAFSEFDAVVAIGAIAVLESVQWLQQRTGEQYIASRLSVYLRWPAYYCLLFSILVFGVFESTQFIYFQF